MTLQWCAEAESYVQELTSEGTPSVDYVLFSLENAKSATPKMELYSMGKGGRNKVEELLLPETHRVLTGAFLASAIDERGSIVSVRRKYIHVIWVGTRVGIMIKGKVNTSLTQPFKDVFPGCAHYVQLSDGDVDDLQAELLEKTLLAAGGAHKPTRYSFTNRTLIGSLSLDESAYDNQAAEEEERRRERLRLEAEARRQKAAEAERQRLAAEEAKRRADEEARRAAEAERRRAEQERMQRVLAQEEERKRRDDEARRKAYLEEQAAKNKAAAMTPKAALRDKSLIMLISSMSGNMTTSTNQARASNMLKGLDVVPELVDGADPVNKDLRTQLFGISGQRGKYPQFFIREKDGSLKFFGNMEDFDYYNDTGTLAQQLGGCLSPKNNNGAEDAPPVPMVESTLNGNKLLLLISSMSGSLEVASNQTRVQGILKGLHLPKEEVEVMDGCEPSVKERRNELFGISGIRAKYPQLFLVNINTGDTSFVGNFDDICYLHDTNTFGQSIGLVSKADADNNTAAAVVTAPPPETIQNNEKAAPPAAANTSTMPNEASDTTQNIAANNEQAGGSSSNKAATGQESTNLALPEEESGQHIVPDETPSKTTQEEATSQPELQQPPPLEDSNPSTTATTEEEPQLSSTTTTTKTPEKPDETKTLVQEEPPQQPVEEPPLGVTTEEEEKEKPAAPEEPPQPAPLSDPQSEPSANDATLPECEPDAVPLPEASEKATNGGVEEEETPEEPVGEPPDAGDGGADTATDADIVANDDKGDREVTNGGEQQPAKDDDNIPQSAEGDSSAPVEGGSGEEDALPENSAASEPDNVDVEVTEKPIDSEGTMPDDDEGPSDLHGVESSVIDETDLPPLVGSDSAMDFDANEAGTNSELDHKPEGDDGAPSGVEESEPQALAEETEG
ncbi:saccharopine dehydrogenase [Seminavis robusta]|uniref:Saccharopine dehydrogenase n=1 Tax=Seminavis robusta TaxID=568900 RepID=A0A9N8ELN2_9STRA|nr:saccharopine dehydrogenase [Seminavis robusta]|eukprot:Sro1410_g270290.1 saccharopine dehydrogenase (905) ;mRNA; r:12958-15796